MKFNKLVVCLGFSAISAICSAGEVSDKETLCKAVCKPYEFKAPLEVVEAPASKLRLELFSHDSDSLQPAGDNINTYWWLCQLPMGEGYNKDTTAVPFKRCQNAVKFMFKHHSDETQDDQSVKITQNSLMGISESLMGKAPQMRTDTISHTINNVNRDPSYIKEFIAMANRLNSVSVQVMYNREGEEPRLLADADAKDKALQANLVITVPVIEDTLSFWAAEFNDINMWLGDRGIMTGQEVAKEALRLGKMVAFVSPYENKAEKDRLGRFVANMVRIYAGLEPWHSATLGHMLESSAAVLDSVERNVVVKDPRKTRNYVARKDDKDFFFLVEHQMRKYGGSQSISEFGIKYNQQACDHFYCQ